MMALSGEEQFTFGSSKINWTITFYVNITDGFQMFSFASVSSLKYEFKLP